MDARKRLILSIIVMFAVYWIGIVGFVWIDGVTIWEALHFTSISLTTVGYGEPDWISFSGQVWSLFVNTFGISTLLIAFASLQAVVIGGELRTIVGRRKLESKIRHLDQHVVICGYGRMGSLVYNELVAEGISCCVIDTNRQRLADLEKRGGLYILGTAESEDTLLEAGILRARTLVACLPDDAANVFVTLTARTMQKGLMIVARAEQPGSIGTLHAAGANRVISPQQIGAARMANIITHPNIVDFFEVAARGVELEMDEYLVKAGSRLEGKTLKDSAFRQLADAIVVAIKRADGAALYNPSADVQLRARDTLIIIGKAGVSLRLGQLA